MSEPPAWANALLHRLTILESRLPANNAPSSSDPNVFVRAPGADFTPPADMRRTYEYMELDFFRRPMEEAERRKFLFECPKNTLRNYQPPKLNKVSLSPEYKQFDEQLHDIQYRLSGLTRPMDWYAYNLSREAWSLEELQEQSSDFVHSLHELISDLASTITNMRTKNFYKGLPSHADPPPSTPEEFLVDTKEMLDHLKLQESVASATQRRKRKNRSHPKRANDGSAPSSQANNSGPTSRRTNNTNNNNTTGSHQPVPQPSTSRGFQQRNSQTRSN